MLSPSPATHNALKSYTVWAALQMFLDDRIGSLETGNDADNLIWDRNPYQVDDEALKEKHCDVKASSSSAKSFITTTSGR